MEISVSDAKAQLTDLVKRAERGEDVTLTRHGQPVALIVSTTHRKSREEFLETLRRIGSEGRMKVTPGPDSAHAADYLYGKDGLPE